MKNGYYGAARIESVDPQSPAAEAGFRAGDRILRIDENPLRDVIDCYTLLACDGRHRLDLERGQETLEIAFETGGSQLGINFERPVFGDIMRCNNCCMFCFVDQLPGGLRDTLYVKDDDYRLSFLGGNFITLTNLGKKDIHRIVSERLSPLYVSLHATEPEVRKQIFGNKNSNRALQIMAYLIDSGIELHLQIVLMIGINDGAHLDATLTEIRSSFSGVSSVGVVPVGLSDCGGRVLPSNFGYDRDSALQVLEQLESWRSSYVGNGPFAADEFFFLAGEEPPPGNYYGGYPQIENGIGLVRSFIDDIAGRTEYNETLPVDETCIVTTPMGAWALSLSGFYRLNVEITVCENSLFGDRVTVCGLLPGEDVERTLAKRPGIRKALVPQVALCEDLFIDGMSLDAVSSSCGVEIVPVGADAQSLASELAGDGGGDG